ncbi:MAG: tryptophan--tRNA ligase [Thermoflexales bacterium]|nr:tryptophan--tRNA ligase [Thermoflexales bacterium]
MDKQHSVFSGIQPTGELHLGNYLGAVANWVRLQDNYDCRYCVVDLHAMTMPYDIAELRANTENMLIGLLACGIDPARANLCLQSLVPEHTELQWVFSCVCAYGDLMRQTQFKDKMDQLEGQQGAFISAGLFTYPVLQAADILLYRADYVPVGKDQEQHLELSREIARRFNFQFGEFFPEPRALATPTPKVLSLADPTRKMSKSLGPKHYVGLFEEEKSVRAKVRSAVTDTGEGAGEGMSPGVENLFSLLAACGDPAVHAALLKEYEAGNRRYALLKDAVADALVALTSRLRARRAEIAADVPGMWKQVRAMSEVSRDAARATLREVRKLTGLPSL